MLDFTEFSQQIPLISSFNVNFHLLLFKNLLHKRYYGVASDILKVLEIPSVYNKMDKEKVIQSLKKLDPGMKESIRNSIAEYIMNSKSYIHVGNFLCKIGCKIDGFTEGSKIDNLEVLKSI